MRKLFMFYNSLIHSNLLPPPISRGNIVRYLLVLLLIPFALSSCDHEEGEAVDTSLTRSAVDSIAADSTRHGLVLGDTTWSDTLHISYDSLSINTGDTITDGDADEAAARRNKE